METRIVFDRTHIHIGDIVRVRLTGWRNSFLPRTVEYESCGIVKEIQDTYIVVSASDNHGTIHNFVFDTDQADDITVIWSRHKEEV